MATSPRDLAPPNFTPNLGFSSEAGLGQFSSLPNGTHFYGNHSGGLNLTMEQLTNSVQTGSAVGEQLPVFDDMSMIKTIVLSVMFAIAFIGNLATLVRMYKMRKRKSTINTLIMHLAGADLIVTFFCNVTDAVWAYTVQWYAGNALCKITKFMQVFGLYLSTYVIVIISIDRCLAILDPMSRNKAPVRVRYMIIFAWVLSAVFSTPQAFIFRVLKGPFKEDFYQCVTYGFYNQKWQEKLYSCLSVLFMFVLPLITMVTAYTLIFFTIARKSRELQEHDQATDTMLRGQMRSQLFRKAKVKSLRMTALIVAAFIVCWTPYYVAFIVFTFNDYQSLDHSMYMWIFFFGMANSMINPLIYGAFHVCKPKRRSSGLEVLSWRDLRCHHPLAPLCESIPNTSSVGQPPGCQCYRGPMTPVNTRMTKLANQTNPHARNGGHVGHNVGTRTGNTSRTEPHLVSTKAPSTVKTSITRVNPAPIETVATQEPMPS